MINVRSNIQEFSKGVERTSKKHLPYAVSVAINNTALKAQQELIKHTKVKVHMPVAFTSRNATFVIRSSKYDSPISATVGFKDRQASYLKYLETGGVSTSSTGAMKPVPVDKYKNKFGNLPKKRIDKLLANKEQYFSGYPAGGGEPGVFKRLGKRVKRQRKRGGDSATVYQSYKLERVATWEQSTTHKPVTRYGERVQIIVDRNFSKELKKQFDAALK